MADSLLVLMPDKQAHAGCIAALSILIKGRILTPYVTEVGLRGNQTYCEAHRSDVLAPQCTFCNTGARSSPAAPGDERHLAFDCPHFAHVCRHFGDYLMMLMEPCICSSGTFFDGLNDLTSVRAWHKPIRQCFVHAACPDPCEILGQLVTLRLVDKLAASGDMALEKILKTLSGIHIAWALKNSMVLILYRLVTVII